MDQEPIYYLNGKFVKRSDAKISLDDLGLLRGFGIFDFIVTYNNGRPFLLQKHIQRLKRSGKLIGLDFPWTSKTITEIVKKTVAKNKNGNEKSIRIVVTGGESEDSMSLSHKPTFAVMVKNKKIYPAKYYSDGIKVITHDYNREAPQAKSLNYTQAVKAVQIAKKKKAVEAIYINKKLDKVYEGTSSNLFIVKANKVITPDGDTLPGITREVIVKLCKKSFPTVIREVKISEIFEADELFLTATNKEVMPIVQVDNKKISGGKVGDVTRKIIASYKDFINSNRWE